jgi:hypothetical protein
MVERRLEAQPGLLAKKALSKTGVSTVGSELSILYFLQRKIGWCDQSTVQHLRRMTRLATRRMPCLSHHLRFDGRFVGYLFNLAPYIS